METINLLCEDERIKTSKKGLKATADRNNGYYRCLYIDDFIIELDYNWNLWKDTLKIDTPFWVRICNHDWEQTDEMLQVMQHIDIEYKDTETYNCVFLALQPLPNATLEEVCNDLKSQILKYIDMFR